MKKTIRNLLAAAVLLGVPGVALAEVNCDQVRRYAQTGRSADEIAETMIVDIAEVQKCLAGEATNPAPTPAP